MVIKGTIGITTTVPIEVLIAAGYRPVDLNNIFVTDRDPARLVTMAERDGFPLTCCTWIKGLYGVCLDRGIDTVLGVTTGDCSNTRMLLEVLELRGVRVVAFDFPSRPDGAAMRAALESLCDATGTSLAAAEAERLRLKRCREPAAELDALTWDQGLVTSGENHLWLVSTSDFNGDPASFERDIYSVIRSARGRVPAPAGALRLAYLGVPPIFARDLYSFVEAHGARVVLNEVQRQFSMPFSCGSLAEQYTRYTYPYSTAERLADILPELDRRRVDGAIHYVQAFCHQEIGDIVLRQRLGVPVLTLQGGSDFTLSVQTMTRLEAFLDMLQRRRNQAKRQERGDSASVVRRP